MAGRGRLVALVAAGGLVAVAAAASVPGQLALPQLPAPDRLTTELPAASELAAARELEPADGTDPARDTPAGTDAVTGVVDAGQGPLCLGAARCTVWQTGLDRSLRPFGLDVADGLLLAPTTTGLSALDLDTGVARWSVPVPSPAGRSGPAGVAVAGDLVLVAGPGGQVLAHELATGREVWTGVLPRAVAVRRATLVDGHVVLTASVERTASTELVVAGFDARSGRLRWERTVRAAAVGTAGAVAVDPAGRLVGLDAASGEPRWVQERPGPPPELLAVGPLVLVLDPGSSALLDVRSGEPVAELGTSAVLAPLELAGSEVVPGDRVAVLVGPDGVRWRAQVPGGGCCTGARLLGDEVWLRLSGGHLLVLDRRDGSVLEQREPLVAGDDGRSAPGWLLGGLEFSPLPPEVAIGDARLRVRDVATGATLAQLPAIGPVAVDGDDVVVVGEGWVARLTPPAG